MTRIIKGDDSRDDYSRGWDASPVSSTVSARREVQPIESVTPNLLVRWAFYISIISLFFGTIYLPGTGERIGVSRLAQVLLIAAAISQPRVCLRRVPTALLWFVGFYLLRLAWGFWLSPDLMHMWRPTLSSFFTFLLPWVWFMYNVIQHRPTARNGLWALVITSSFCAALHVAGIGTQDLGDSPEARSTLFGENANSIGITYAIAIIAMVGLAVMSKMKMSRRLILLLLVGLIGIGLAKTASRTAALTAVLGILILMFPNRAFIPALKRFAILIAVAAIFGAVLYQSPSVVNRLRGTQKSASNRPEPRARMLPVLWEIFQRSPIYGTGPDAYQMELTRRAMPYLLLDFRTIPSHNVALLLLVETGLIGFFVFSTGVAIAVRAAWRARSGTCGLLPMAMLLPLVFAGCTSTNPTGNGVFWMAIAYALAGPGSPLKIPQKSAPAELQP